MNGQCIIKYASAPLKITGSHTELVSAEDATVFTNEAEAWQAAKQIVLPMRNVEVVDREEELRR